MTRSSRTSITSVAVALLVASILLAGGGAGAAIQRTVRVPAAAFVPVDGGAVYFNDGLIVRNWGAARQTFVAVVPLEGNDAALHSITIHYFDNGPGNLCASIHRSRITNGADRSVSAMCTRGAVADPRSKTDVTLRPDGVGSHEAVYVRLALDPGLDYGFLGVEVVYTSDV